MALVNTDEYSYDPSQRIDNGGFTGGGFPTSSGQPTYTAPTAGTAPMAPSWIQNDYWAPDRATVLADPTRWGTGPNGEIDPRTTAAQQKPAAANPFDINAWGQNWLKSGGRTLQDFQNYVGANPLGAGYSLSGSKGDKVLGPGGYGWDAVIASGLGGNGASWNPFGPGMGGGGGTAAGQIFNDPATQQWEQLIRTLTERLQQPQPTWTPAQLELQQTQMLDPLERQRQALKQQTIQKFAQMGHGQNSGPLQQALQDIDRQFSQLETQSRANIATQAIGREDQLFANNENRALAAANLFKQIPQYADTRLGQANSILQQNNPAQLLGLMNAFQNTGFQQNLQNQYQQQQFWSQLLQYLSPLFGS